MRKPTVLIAEDDPILREQCLRPTLEPLFDVIDAVDDGNSAVASARRHKPKVVLLDISLPGLRGFAAARKILAANPQIKIVFVSNYEDQTYVEEAIRLGASGYVPKSRAFRDLVKAIEAALAGSFYQP